MWESTVNVHVHLWLRRAGARRRGRRRDGRQLVRVGADARVQVDAQQPARARPEIQVASQPLALLRRLCCTDRKCRKACASIAPVKG